MATLSCRCGKVVLQLTTSRARVSTECCCDSCFNRAMFLSERRGGTCIDDKNTPIVCMKWDNRVTIVQGREYMFVYKLTPQTNVFNIASSCCYTFLLGRNDDYDAHCLTTNEVGPIWGGHYERIEPSSRWFVNQWSDTQRAKLKPLMGIWVDAEGNLDGEDGWKSVFEEHFAAMNAPIDITESEERATSTTVGETETFDQVLKSLDSVPIVIVSEIK
jgi:hypothetical protein